MTFNFTGFPHFDPKSRYSGVQISDIRHTPSKMSDRK